MTYSLDQNGGIIRVEDGACIPIDHANRDYVEYLQWAAQGNETGLYVRAAQVITADMVRAEGARRLALIGERYCKEERETWPQQVEEAKALSADANAEAPLLVRLAAPRGITVVQMAAVVIVKANAFASAAGDILAAQGAILAMDPIPTDFADDRNWP